VTVGTTVNQRRTHALKHSDEREAKVRRCGRPWGAGDGVEAVVGAIDRREEVTEVWSAVTRSTRPRVRLKGQERFEVTRQDAAAHRWPETRSVPFACLHASPL
jgi:hypothetical protein